MKSFSELKKERASSYENLTKKLKESQTTYADDSAEFWKPTRDKVGSAYATIRFLPPTKGESLPFVSYFSHAFKNEVNGKWYIENSLTSIDKPDPLGEFNTKLWDTGNEEKKDQARKQKRKLNYVANIYVVSDPANKEAEGKVFKYKFGKTVFDMINDAMIPEFPDVDPIKVFDFWEGANFKLKIHIADGWPKYTKSTFDLASPLFKDDDELEKIWNLQYPLEDIISEDNFKTYEKLKERLKIVLGEQFNKVMGSSEIKEKLPEDKGEEPKAKVEQSPEVEKEDDIPWDESSKSEDGDEDFGWLNEDD